MADKEVPLSIVLRTVDRATAGIQAVNKRLDAITKPTREFGKALSEFGDKSGINAVMEGFRGVGGAVTDLIGKVAVVGGVIAGAVVGVLSLIDHFDKLGDTAERLGTSADFLAAFRFAAERAGAPIEGVDQALQSLVTNMGQAKAGTGRMLKFLNQISPTLAKQVTSANSLEEALGLLADASAKLPDAARRGALAMKTLGDPALAPLLARGSKGMQELLTEFARLAGSQGDAADAAGKTDDALKNLHAATEGVKAALVTGLAPALKTVIEQLTEWLVDHREDVRQWAEDIGKKLPAAVDAVVSAVTRAVRWVAAFVDGIGGWKVAAGALALVMAGPLISAVTSLGIAMLATPFGQIVLGLAAVTAGVVELIGFVRGLGEAFDTTNEKMLEDSALLPPEAFRAKYPNLPQPTDAMKQLDELAHPPEPWSMMNTGDTRPWARPQLGSMLGPVAPAGAAGAPGQGGQATVKVDFLNAPRGLRVATDPQSTAYVDLSVGYQMLGAGT